MSRILTGIQATGTPHLGNLLGAIIPAIESVSYTHLDVYKRQEVLSDKIEFVISLSIFEEIEIDEIKFNVNIDKN